MTVIQPNSITGINSITVQNGQALNIHDSDGNLIRNIVTATGVGTFHSIKVGSAATISSIGNAAFSGIVTAAQLVSSGSISATLGTFSADTSLSIADKIVHTGDTDTAIRFPGADTIRLETGGTARVNITSAGLVGIGTNDPGGQKLELYNPTSAFNILSIRTGAGAYGQAGIAFGSNQTKDRQKATIFFQERTGSAHHAGDLCFSVDNAGGDAGTADLTTERLRIQGAGHVGIGTSMPTDRVASSNSRILNVGIVTANTVYAAGFIPSNGQSNKKNLLDNGEFIVDQRMGGSATAITPSGGVDYTCDRWHESNYGGEAGRITFQTMSGDVPNSNYRQSIKLDCTTAMGAPSGNNYMAFCQFTEARDNRFLGHGTATAKPVTLQFWIKSTKTGTACVGLARHDASREYIAEYTINSSNTWEKKTITFPGDTSGSEMAMDTGRGFKIGFVLFAGSSRHATVNQWAAYTSSYYSASSNQVNLIDSTSNNIFFTGIQLEVGEVATPFEYRNYGDELLRCQRYYQQLPTSGDHVMWGFGRAESNTARVQIPLTVPLRASPTLTCDANRSVKYDATMVQTTSTPTVFKWDEGAAAMTVNFPSGGTLTHNNVYIVTSDSGSTGFQMDADL